MSCDDAPLSLKARQNASRTLKRIFDQINAPPLPEPLLPSIPGMRQETRDFLSLHGSLESIGDEMPTSEGSIRASPQRSADAKVTARPSPFHSLKMQPDSNMFYFEQRGNWSSQKTRCISPEPFKATGTQVEAATIGKEEEGAMVASQNLGAIYNMQQEGNKRAFRSASPAPSSISQQSDDTTPPRRNGCFTSQGIQTASRPSSSSGTARKLPKAQLTIFYGGVVNVYDDVPADKAHAIMLLAGSGNSWSAPVMNGSISSMPVPSSGAVAAITAPASKELGVSMRSCASPASSSMFSAEMKQQIVKCSHTGLPFARKQSLARFFEQRRDRVQVIKPTNNEPKDALENMEDGTDQAAYSNSKRLCSRPSSPSPPKISPVSGHYVGDQCRPSTPPMTPKRMS